MRTDYVKNEVQIVGIMEVTPVKTLYFRDFAGIIYMVKSHFTGQPFSNVIAL